MSQPSLAEIQCQTTLFVFDMTRQFHLIERLVCGDIRFANLGLASRSDGAATQLWIISLETSNTKYPVLKLFEQTSGIC